MQKSIYIFFASYFLAAFLNLYFFFLQIRLNQRLLRLSLKIIILSKHSLHASDDQANRIVVVESYLLFFVLFIYFPTIWWSRGGAEQVAWGGKGTWQSFWLKLRSRHQGFYFRKRAVFAWFGGDGPLTNTLTNIRKSAGGHSGQGSDLYPQKPGPKVPESTQ